MPAEQGQRGGLRIGAEDRRPGGPGAGEGRFLLLLDEVETAPQSGDKRAQDRAPARADEFELGGQGSGSGQGGSAEEVDQVLVIGTEARLFGEESAEARHDLLIGRLFLRAAVVEQLPERTKGRIQVGQPDHQHLFEGGLPMGDSARLAGQIVLDRELLVINRERRKFVDEQAQRRFDRLRPDPAVSQSSASRITRGFFCSR